MLQAMTPSHDGKINFDNNNDKTILRLVIIIMINKNGDILYFIITTCLFW